MSQAQAKPSRRGVMATLGLATTAVATLVASRKSGAPVPEVTSLAAPQPAPERGGGYSESEHVKRYYKTTRI